MFEKSPSFSVKGEKFNVIILASGLGSRLGSETTNNREKRNFPKVNNDYPIPAKYSLIKQDKYPFFEYYEL